MGLMQVMPGTYRELAQRYNLGPDPYHPYDNLQAGAAYIREMYQLYGNPAFLAAYNAGPRRLEDFLWGGRGLPDETRNYVARVGPRIASTAPARRAPREVYAAADIGTNIPRGPRRMDGGTMMALNQQGSPAPTVQVAQAAAPAPAAQAGTQVAWQCGAHGPDPGWQHLHPGGAPARRAGYGQFSTRFCFCSAASAASGAGGCAYAQARLDQFRPGSASVSPWSCRFGAAAKRGRQWLVGQPWAFCLGKPGAKRGFISPFLGWR
jgi:hypothetical protein